MHSHSLPLFRFSKVVTRLQPSWGKNGIFWFCYLTESEGLRFACSRPGGLLAIAREPFWEGFKELKAKLLRNFDFFASPCLQKQAFDACKTKKKPAFRLAF
jgi:hypothetical protein